MKKLKKVATKKHKQETKKTLTNEIQRHFRYKKIFHVEL